MRDLQRPWDDAPVDVAIWEPAIPRAALLSGALGAVAFGVVGGLVADGVLPVGGAGQWASAGVGPAVVAAAAVGLALGGLVGGGAAVLRMPAAPRGEGAAVEGEVHVLRDGLVAGLLGATAYWLLDHLLAWTTHGKPLEPSRYMASLLVGRDALAPGGLSAAGALILGWVGHSIASLPWGFGLAAVARWRPGLFADAGRAVVVGALFGVVVWLANVYVVAPLLGMPWFTQHDALTMFLVHTPTFGVPAALWLHRRVAG
jgi:hypothetical protein